MTRPRISIDEKLCYEMPIKGHVRSRERLSIVDKGDHMRG